METNIILSEVLFLGILVLAGVVGSASGILGEAARDVLAKIVFNITLPLLLLTTFSGMDVTPAVLYNSMAMVLLTLAVMSLMLLAGWAGAALLRLKRREAAVFMTHALFGNIVFLGFPVIYALYGEEGLLYAGMLQLVSNMLLWSVGVVLLGSGNGSSLRSSLLKVFNINTYAIIAGLLLFVTGIELPAVIMEPMSGLGGTNIYLSMLYMGSMMYHSSIRGMIGKPVVYFLSLQRLIVVPFILLFIFYLVVNVAGLDVDRMVIAVLILQSSMPCMANIVILARIYGADDQLATANVFVSTLLSLGTLPLILYLIGLVFP